MCFIHIHRVGICETHRGEYFWGLLNCESPYILNSIVYDYDDFKASTHTHTHHASLLLNAPRRVLSIQSVWACVDESRPWTPKLNGNFSCVVCAKCYVNQLCRSNDAWITLFSAYMRSIIKGLWDRTVWQITAKFHHSNCRWWNDLSHFCCIFIMLYDFIMHPFSFSQRWINRLDDLGSDEGALPTYHPTNTLPTEFSQIDLFLWWLWLVDCV